MREKGVRGAGSCIPIPVFFISMIAEESSLAHLSILYSSRLVSLHELN